MSTNPLRRLRKDEKGSALVEATILTPVLMLLVFGVLEFSYYFYQQHIASTGVEDAARYLAHIADPTDANAQLIAQNLAATGYATGGPLRTTGFQASDVVISFSFVPDAIDPVTGLRPYRQPVDPTTPDTVRLITVTGSFPWSPLALFWGYLGFGAKIISVTHTERWLGQS
jgi:hypothetical protein